MILTKQYLDSGTYTISLENSTELDLTSYVYTRFGTFKIVPVSQDVQTFEALEKYQVFIDNGLIGEVYLDSYSSTFEESVAFAMATAIDIVTSKINELVDLEERAVLSKLVDYVIGSINIPEEQKAMYRTFLIEQDKLDDVIEELENPTDILGEDT